MTTWLHNRSEDTMPRKGDLRTEASPGHFTTQRAALAGILGPALWVSLLILLDTLQYDFLVSIGANPLRTAPASENGMGPYGWLYVASDFLLGLLVVIFAVGLRRMVKRSWWARLGFAAQLAFGFGFMVGAAPCECLPGQQPGLSGQLHTVASLVLLLATIPMPLFMGLAFRGDERWQRYAWYSILTGLLAPVLFVTVNSLPPVFSWFYLWLLAIPYAWLMVIAHQLWQLAQSSNEGTPNPAMKSA
jgi:hypothetical protein